MVSKITMLLVIPVIDTQCTFMPDGDGVVSHSVEQSHAGVIFGLSVSEDGDVDTLLTQVKTQVKPCRPCSQYSDRFAHRRLLITFQDMRSYYVSYSAR